jgi:hypothetical protein
MGTGTTFRFGREGRDKPAWRIGSRFQIGQLLVAITFASSTRFLGRRHAVVVCLQLEAQLVIMGFVGTGSLSSCLNTSYR